MLNTWSVSSNISYKSFENLEFTDAKFLYCHHRIFESDDTVLFDYFIEMK